MTICERMFWLIDSKTDKNAAGLAKSLGVTTAQTTNWKARGTDPPAKYIANICEYLEVTPMWLLTGEDGADRGFDIDGREKNLIEHFRALDYDGKARVETTAANEHDRMRLEGDSAKTAT